MSCSRFVLRLATVQALCNLARVVLELHRLDEICVPIEVSLSMQFTTLHFLMTSFNTDLPSWRLVLEHFPPCTVKYHFSEPFLVSIFALFVSFSSPCFLFVSILFLGFLVICCSKVTTRPTGFTRLRLCVGVVLTLVTSVSTDTSFILAAIGLDAAVRPPQVNSSPSEPCSLSVQLVSLRRA